MPSQTPKQARFMRAVAHGWKPDRVPAPPMKVAAEFMHADAQHMAHGGPVMQMDPIVLRGTPPPEQPVPGSDIPLELDPIKQATAAANAPDASRALGDPDFRAFVAQRARALAQAQADAAGRQKWADLASGFERGGAMIAGRPVDKEHIASLNARAQQPVTQLAQQNAAESQAVKDLDASAQLNERSAKAARMKAEDDPNSTLSQRAKLLAKAQGLIPAGYDGPYSYSMHNDVLKGATLQEAIQHHKATQAQAGAMLAETKARHDEQARHDKEMEKIAGAKAAKDKEIPARQLERYAAIRATQDELPKYLADLDAADKATTLGNGPIAGRLNAANPYHDDTVSAAEGKRHALKIKLARALHGGVPTKVEIDEAGQYIPTIRDTKEQRQAKHDAIKGILDSEVDTLKQTYGEGGLKNTRLSTGDAGAAITPKGPARVQSDEDFNALPSGTVFVGPDGKTRRKP